MTPRLVRKHCVIDETSKALLERAIQKMGLSARAYDRILKVSRTIADLDRSESIQSQHISEAIQYRTLDRQFLALTVFRNNQASLPTDLSTIAGVH